MINKKNKILLLIYCLFFLLIVISCNETLEIDIPDFSEKLVVESFLVNTSNRIFLKLSKTVSPYKKLSWYDTTLLVHNAQVKVKLDNNEYNMIEDTVSSVYNNGYIYKIFRKTGEYYINNVNLLNVNKCELNIDYENNHVNCMEYFPDIVQIDSIQTTLYQKKLSNWSNPINYLKIKIFANFPKNQKSFYRICLVSNYGSLDYEFENIETDYFIHLSNENYEIIDLKLKYENLEYYLKRTRVYLDHITENHYNFMKAKKNQEEDVDNPFGSEGIQIPTNITNGLGIFTCISRDTICINLK